MTRPALPTPPSVAVVIPTRNRPQLLRNAITSVLAQDYPGPLEVIVVFDGTTPDTSLDADAPRTVRAVANSRAPGLCGSRNTGILRTNADYVAFLDDDDTWLPGKLSAQVDRMRADPAAEFASTAITVSYGASSSARVAGRSAVTYDELLRSRMAMLHSSTFLVRRAALLDGIGLVDEDIPGGMCEDWDLLLRGGRRHPVVHVDEPLVRVLWGTTSYFADRWETKIRAHRWMLEHHPDILTSPVGAARVFGQLAFSCAALGRRGESGCWALRALRRNPREPRAYLALLVASGVVRSGTVLASLHRRGHGI